MPLSIPPTAQEMIDLVSTIKVKQGEVMPDPINFCEMIVCVNRIINVSGINVPKLDLQTGNKCDLITTISALEVLCDFTAVTTCPADSPYCVDDVITFTVNPANGVAPYEYRIRLPNEPFTNWGTSNTWNYTALASDIGTHNIEMRIRDANGEVALVVCVIEVELCSDLQALANCPTGSPFCIGDVETFSVSEVNGVAPFTYQITYPDGVMSGFGTSSSWGHLMSAPVGTKTIVMEVKDATGTIAIDTCDFEVIDCGGTLTATANCPTGSPYCIGDSIPFSIVASGGTAPYEYRAELPNLPFTNWGSSNSFVHTAVIGDVGSHVVEMRVRDANGDVAIALCVIEIINCGNVLVASTNCPTGSPFCVGDTETFSVTASGGTAPYTYQIIYPDGSLSGFGAASSWNHLMALPLGNQTIILQVQDANNDISSVSCNFEVIDCGTGGLSATAICPTGSPFCVGDTETFSINASGGTAPYTYQITYPDLTQSGFGAISSWNHLMTTPIGNQVISMQVMDSLGDIFSDSCSFEVIDCGGTPLTATANCPSQSPYCVGDSIPFSIVASGGTGPYEYRAELPNLPFTNWGSSNSFVHTAVASDIGAHVVEMRVRDANGAVAIVVCEIEIIDCSSGLTATPICPTGSPFCIGDVETFSIVENGGTAPYTYQITYPDGVMSGFGATSSWNHLMALPVGTQTIVMEVKDVTGAVFPVSCDFEVEQCCDPDEKCILVHTDLGGPALGDDSGAGSGFDADDHQSLVHFLQHTDMLTPKCFVSVTSRATPNGTPVNLGPQAARLTEWIQRTDLDHLISQGVNVISEADALAMVSQGHSLGGAPSAARINAGSNKTVQAMRDHKIRCPEAPLPRLWILTWGPVTTLAQALWQLQQSGEEDLTDCVGVYSIGNWNFLQDEAAYNWMNSNTASFPNMLWIRNNISFEGAYVGGNQSGNFDRINFLQNCIRPFGTTNNGMFSETTGEAFPIAANPVGALKEGDSPSWWYLKSCAMGISDSENPADQSSWGGYFQNIGGNVWEDADYATYQNLSAAQQAALIARINTKRTQWLNLYKSRWLDY